MSTPGNIGPVQAQHQAEDFAIAHCMRRNSEAILGMGMSGRGGSGYPRPWQIKLHNTTGTADFKYCALVIGPCTLFNADIDGHSISGGSTDAWISVKYSTASGEMTIVSGGEYTDVTDQTPPADPEFVQRLLYKLKRSGVGKPWRVEVDYRSLGLGIYL